MSVGKLTNSLWKLQLIGWSMYFVLMLLTFLTRDTDETFAYILAVKSFRTATGFSLSCALWLIYRNIATHNIVERKNLNRDSMGKTIIIILVLSILFGILWTLIETIFFWATLPNFDIAHSLQYKPRVALSYGVTLLAWSAIYFGIAYWKQVQIEHQDALNAALLAETAQLDLLRYQLNPHFLFNALNSIRASVSPNNTAAKEMITQLSEFLRHSLMSNNNKESTLSEEFESLENYLAIEKVRFEEALEVELNIAEKAKTILIPSFLLNPLVENAIKHGFLTGPEVLKVHVSARLEIDGTLIIEVKNTGHLNSAEQNTRDRTKIGLYNVQERLKKQLPDKSSFRLFEENGFVVASIKIAQ